VRVYAKSGPSQEHRSWLSAIRKGQTFVTNGPLLSFTLDGHDVGDSITVSLARPLRVHVTLKSNVPVDHLELVSHGKVVARLDGAADTTFDVAADRTGWFLVRAYSDKPRLPILDLYPFASTSPIYVRLGDARPSCGEDAEYFLKWIDLVTQRVRADTNWNTAAERGQTLETIARARAIFAARR
jgi:hypothetical protein